MRRTCRRVRNWDMENPCSSNRLTRRALTPPDGPTDTVSSSLPAMAARHGSGQNRFVTFMKMPAAAFFFRKVPGWNARRRSQDRRRSSARKWLIYRRRTKKAGSGKYGRGARLRNCPGEQPRGRTIEKNRQRGASCIRYHDDRVKRREPEGAGMGEAERAVLEVQCG